MKKHETAVITEPEGVEVVIYEDTLSKFKRNMMITHISLILLLVTLLSDADIRMMLSKSNPWIMCSMYIYFLFSMAEVMYEKNTTCIDTEFVEDMSSGEYQINLKKREVPTDNKSIASFFTVKYARLCEEVSKNQTEGKISTEMTEVFKVEYFSKISSLETRERIFTLLGIIGTLIGIGKAIGKVSEGIDVTKDMSYAFSTTLVAAYCVIAIIALSHVLKTQKIRLFYMFINTMNSAIKKEGEANG